MSTRGRQLLSSAGRRVRHLVPDVIRRRYALKFAIALMVLGLGIGATGLAATTAVSQGVEDIVLEEQSTLATQEARNLDAWNERNELVVESLINSEAVRRGNTSGSIQFNQVSDYLNSRKGDLPEDVVAVHYVNYTERQVTATSNLGLAATDLSTLDRPWTNRESAPTSVVRTETHGLPDENGEVVVAYVQKIPGIADRALVLVASVKHHSGTIESTGESGTTVVVDSRDRIVFDQSNQHLLDTYGDGQVLSAARAASEDASAGSVPAGAVRTEAAAEQLTDASGIEAGEESVVGYATVPGTEWIVLVHRPVEDVYGFVTTVQRFGIAATVLGVLLVAAVGAVLGRNTATAIDRLTTRTRRMESGDLNVSFETDRIDSIGRLYEGLAKMRDALRTQIEAAEEARQEAEAARQEAEATNRHLREKADAYSEAMRACADGDLTRRTDPDSRSEAMAEIGRDLNAMLDEFETTVGRLSSFAGAVATGSAHVDQTAREVRGASEQVTESVQAITDGAARQSDTLQTVSAEVEDLSSTTEQIATSADQVAAVAERTAEVGAEGRSAAETAIEGLSAIETESELAVEEIEALLAEVEGIDELLEFIDRVADELNILALNANIEASRAGTGGDGDTEGFAVVADQVKELATETQHATEDIEARLERVEAQTAAAAEEVQQTSDEVAAQAASIESAMDALDEIAGYAEETNEGVQEISAATRQQASTTEELVTMVDEVAAISQQTAGEAERVAAAAEEQTASLSEVTDHAGELSDRAGRLRDALDRFETTVELDGDERSKPALPGEQAD